MKWLTWWKNDLPDEEMHRLEAKLTRNMISVPPRAEFVSGLRQSLLRQIPEEVEMAISTQKRRLQTGLLVAGGIFGGILVVLSGIRGVVSLVGVTSLLINWFRQNSQQASLSTPSKRSE